MPERHDGHVGLEVELQHREVRVRIAADDFRVRHAPVGELRADQVRRGDDVMIGDHVRGAIDDHAGAQALFESLAIARPGVAKQLFDGIGLNALGDQARRIDVDHGGRRPLDGFGVRVGRARRTLGLRCRYHGCRRPAQARAREQARAQVRWRASSDELRAHYHGDECRGESDDRRGGDESQESQEWSSRHEPDNPHRPKVLALIRMCIMRRLPGSRSAAYCGRSTSRCMNDPEVSRMSDHAADDTVPEVDESRRKFLIAATAGTGAVGAVLTAVPFVASWKPSESARAAGLPTEVDLSKIEPGQMATFFWRKQQIYVVKRTPEMLASLGKHRWRSSRTRSPRNPSSPHTPRTPRARSSRKCWCSSAPARISAACRRRVSRRVMPR